VKPVEETTCCVVDFGSFLSLAEKLSETCKKVYYHRSIEREFRSIGDFAIGDGIPSLELVESFMHPDVVEETDWYCFPDIGYGGEQKYLRSIGKPVWGSNGADELERIRSKFIKKIKSVGLPVAPSQIIKGLTNLTAYLKENDNQWVKINQYRKDMETWHHIDYLHSIPELQKLAWKFGGMADHVVFVVQAMIEDATEIGYDGWCIDGWFPDSSFQGYERKNELYLGAQTKYDDLPEEVRFVNEAWSKVMEEAQYRNFFASEIRNKDGTPYFIDPTMRMPGQTGEQLLETLENIADVMWHGAQGEFVQPKWNAKFAGSATLHYKGDLEDWKVIRVPEESKRWVKLGRYCIDDDGAYWFAPRPSDDCGVVIGMADDIMETIEAVKENFEPLKDEPLSINPDEFMEVLKDIQKAEKEGIEFTKSEVPEPISVVEN
jgi:hypothetical protein